MRRRPGPVLRVGRMDGFAATKPDMSCGGMTGAHGIYRPHVRRTGLLTALRVQAFSGGTEHVDCSKSGNMDTLECGCFQRVTGL